MGRIKIVRASAGSGKTYRLSYEYVKRALSDPESYRHILAVTFTNKATEEMKRRIVAEINDLANGQTAAGKPAAFAAELARELRLSPDELKARAERIRTRILHDYSRFTILTIDKFFQRIIRAFIRELGIESDFTLELQTDSVLDSAADRLIDRTLSDQTLRDWIGRYVEEQLEQGGRWDIRRELTRLGKEIFNEDFSLSIASGPLRERMQQIISEATGQVKKIEAAMVAMATEAVRIIAENGLEIADFYYGKTGFVRYFYTVASGNVWGATAKKVADALEPDAKWAGEKSPRKEDVRALVPRLKPLLAAIYELYNRHLPLVRTTALLRENFRAFALLSDLSETVREACDERNVMLISETNRIISRLIGDNDTPFLFEKAGNHFSHFLIDEFQDTSQAQWNNFLPLLTNAVAQSEDDPVLLVGDVKQSIYRWRGGDWRILGEQASRAFTQAEELTLGQNFRSDGNVVRFNNEMIASAVQRANGELNELIEAQGADVIDNALREELTDTLSRAYSDCRQEARVDRVGQGYVQWIQYDAAEEGDDAPEKILVETVEELQRRGFRPGDIAVVVRKNSEAVAAADYLLDYKSAHPESPYSYDVVTQQALIVGRSPVVRFVIACFRLAVDGQDSIPRALFLKTLGRSVTGELAGEDAAFLATLCDFPIEEAFERILLRYRPDRQPGSVPYLQAFHDQLLAFAESRIADIPLFLRWWDETGAAESIHLPGGQNAITIITIHKAKGLEFPAVIMPRVSWNLNPTPLKTLLWAETAQEPFGALGKMPVRYKKEMAESGFAADYYRELVYGWVDNLNLLYVALTRAGQELYLVSPRQAMDKKGERKIAGPRVNDLLARTVRQADGEVMAGDYPGTVTETDSRTVYRWGEPKQRETASGSGEGVARVQDDYPTFRFSGKLRLRREGERYRDEQGGWQLSPRQYGRLMHRVFEAVSTRDEIAPTLDRFEAEGTLSASDRERVAERIAEALADPLIASWFDGSWETIRNENDIIVPAHTASVRRPDRVMIRGERVVVVDYKFGERENPHYLRQIEEYLRLLRAMGYSRTEGYLWYVEMGRVQRI
jgi:ATP-dependent exoDNAse (exonuclease V) beta subunit